MSNEPELIMQSFEGTFGRPPAVVSTAPGRVNLIGEHTDYNGGFVLPVAIDRAVTVAAAAREDGRVRVYSAEYEARDDWKVDAPRRTGREEWRDYVRGVAWALLDARYEIRGADLLICGDVPQGAGLSSSAALELAVAGAFCAVSEVEVAPAELAAICQRAENQFVGVQCGIMDQLASACGRSGHALLIDCQSLEIEPVPLPLLQHGVALVVVDSKVPRRLADTPYNARREECAAAAGALGVDSLRDAGLDDMTKLAEPLPRRARHVVTENARVLSAVQALKDGDLATFGARMYESHDSLRDDFEVSCPELDLLVSLAFETHGVLGARLTGAGFGGCTVNLVEEASVEPFRHAVLGQYGARTGLAAEIHILTASDGLSVTRV